MKVHERLAELATLGATDAGIDRALFTPAEHAARSRFAAWARASGLHVEQDRAGNVFARLPGSDDIPPVQCGSHLDTVRNGGAYDGAYGVIGGLEALERIAAALVPGERLRRPLEVVAWAGEEGSRFPLGCLGSAVYAGLTRLAEARALIADDGISFAHALHGAAGLLADVPVRADFPPPAAYVELHIEQGPVMEREGVHLGVVTAIAGQRRYAVEIAGEAGHARTVPMRHRADALCAAAEFTLAVERAAVEVGQSVATIGRLAVDPNQTNIVPGRVTLRIDARSVDDARVDAMHARFLDAAARLERRRNVRFTIEPLETRPSTPMNEHLRNILHLVCGAWDERAIDIASGAGHDAMCVANVAPAAMIFVPSAGGRSHVGSERTAPDDLELGIQALTSALLAIHDDLDSTR
ncbi:MAG: M20 family metallo-hydrolase [Candidatus Velthaea sp.]